MTPGDKMRLSQIRTDGLLTEDFTYDAESRVSNYKQTVDYRTNYPMEVSYLYDSLDRVTDIQYPAQYGLGVPAPRKLIQNSYDVANRLSSLKVGGTEVAGTISYNASDQTEQIKIGAEVPNQVTETYQYDNLTGLLTNQTVTQNGSQLLNLSYDYARNNSIGNQNGKTGHLTKIINNLDSNKNREYKFDALGRLTEAKGGNARWQQNYSYDRYGNRTNVSATGTAADNSPIPTDGIPNLTYNTQTNRITTAGFEYDSAGNQTRSKAEDGVTWLKYEYDSANRLRIVKKDDGTLLQSFQYGSTNQRLMDLDYQYGYLKIFGHGGAVEYTEFAGAIPTWTKSYVYLGDSQLSTITPNGSGGEITEYNHPDRLGVRLTTNQQNGTSFEQTTLPFGTALNAETTRSESKRFTSYERSARTGLDYAVNRTYDSKQGRFTQVDPIGMNAVNFNLPQTLNLYNYCGNDPINHTDPDGLFWGAIGRFFKKAFKWIMVAISVAIAVLTIIYAPVLFSSSLKLLFGVIGALANAASSVLNAFGLSKAGAIFGIIGAAASFGTSILAARSSLNWKTLFAAISSGATAASRTLTFLGYRKLGQIFGLISTVTGFISSGLKVSGDKTKGFKYAWDSSIWKIYKFARSTGEQVANLAGATRVAGFLNVFGIIDDVGDSYQGIRDFLQNDVAGGEKVNKLDFWKNTKRLLTGSEEINARFGILLVNVLRRSNTQVGRINGSIRRIERGIALAH